jgi:signal transduction histidine kinase
MLIFYFVYWQMTNFETLRIKKLLEQQAYALSQASSDQIHWSINKKIYVDFRQVTFSALFDKNLNYIEGNIATFPSSVPIDGAAHRIEAADVGEDRRFFEQNIFVATRLPDTRILLIGRNIQDLGHLKEIVVQILKIGVFPMALLTILIGALLGRRMNHRLRSAQKVLTRFQQGQLRQRLPLSKSRDELDLFSAQVNSMLTELERVVNELHHVGNNIAHNLRTPLARVQACLENAQRLTKVSDAAFEPLNQAIVGLNQTFVLTTALLRAAQIESGKTRALFGPVDLSDVVTEAADLYGPVAEARRITLEVDLQPTACIEGDKDLLLEALANLLDNAIKFSPEQGHVKISLSSVKSGAIVSVADTGPGILEKDRSEIFNRFYRSSQSGRVAGSGLGLTLVAAIVRLHNFSVEVKGGSHGSVFELRCFPHTLSSR